LGAALGWGANPIRDAWKTFNDTIQAAHAKNTALVESTTGANAKSKISMSTLKTAAADAYAAVQLLSSAALATLPNGDDTVIASVAVGTGISASTLAAGADVIVGYCGVPFETKPKLKLWKLLLGLFIVSGPPGAIAGLFSWMAYHVTEVSEAMKKIGAKLLKVGKTVATFAKVLAGQMKNFWLARVLPAGKSTLSAFKEILPKQKALVQNTLKKGAKVVYFFPQGNMLKEMIGKTKQKLKAFFGDVKNFFGKKSF
jgi:hypothetical protein